MKRTTVRVNGMGDACARSTSAAEYDEMDDPERGFEIELLAALEEAELELSADTTADA